MAASVGPSPFNDYAGYRKFRAARKKEIHQRWDPTHGWRIDAKRPKMKKIRSSQGNVYEVPDNDIVEYETYFRTIGSETEQSAQYKEGGGRLKNVQTPADYIDYAFGSGSKAEVLEQDGCGHISYLWYVKRYQLLKVQFTTNGSIVVFFRVPLNLAATLFALAQSKTEKVIHKGVNPYHRHLLGIYFWDLVRIRGTVHGSRYKFQYVKDNSSGNLTGRPYGSGEDFWEKESGPNKNIATAIDALRKQRSETAATKQLLQMIQADPDLLKDLKNADIRSGSEAMLDHSENAGATSGYGLLGELAGRPDSIKKLDESISALDERISELEAQQYDVTRNVKTPSARSLPANTEFGNPDALEGLSERQKSELRSANYGRQQRMVQRHNETRRAEITWDVDRLDDYVETLDRERRLPGGNVDAFYRKYSNAGDQFDALKRQGLIPMNAVYRQGD